MNKFRQYWGIVLGLSVFGLVFLSLAPSSVSTSAKKSFENPLSDREFFYWFALSDFGNLAWIDRELDLSGKSANRVQSEKSGEMGAFISDLTEQREMAHDTLAGVFPLLRFFFKKILFAPEELNPFEIIDDVEVIAATSAVNNQLQTILDNWKSIPHFDVLFLSNPLNIPLETEALYLFNLHSKFFVHNLREKQVFWKNMD